MVTVSLAAVLPNFTAGARVSFYGGEPLELVTNVDTWGELKSGADGRDGPPAPPGPSASEPNGLWCDGPRKSLDWENSSAMTNAPDFTEGLSLRSSHVCATEGGTTRESVIGYLCLLWAPLHVLCVDMCNPYSPPRCHSQLRNLRLSGDSPTVTQLPSAHLTVNPVSPDH